MEFTNTPTQFLFPLLKTSEILDCMAELGIDISKAELAEPHRHKEKLKKVFTMLLEMCCGVDSEKDLNPSQQALDKAATMGYPELHDVSTDVKLFRLLRNCLHTYGVHDFSWKDLHAPNNKRLRYQLSAFINMAKFRNDEMRLFAAMNGPVCHWFAVRMY
jgi:kinetochore protein Nuf2